MKRAVVTALATLVLATSASARVREVCAWDNPGLNKFVGSRLAAVMSYEHIPIRVRLRLAVRAVRSKAEHVVAITRSGIEGNAGIMFENGGEVNDMHFGRNEKCATVTRFAWAPDDFQTTDLWCDGVFCVGSPRICGNVFWTRRVLPSVGSGPAVMGVPEPSTALLLLVGALGWLAVRRK